MQFPPQLNQTVKFGLAYFPVGLFVGIFISFNAVDNGYEYFYVSSGVSAFVTASFFWWLLASKQEVITLLRCCSIGFLTGTFSHYICWYMITVFPYLSNLGKRFVGINSAEETVNLIEAFEISGMLSFFSLFFVGWLTIISGVIISIVFKKLGGIHGAP